MQNKYTKIAIFAFIFALALVAFSVKAEGPGKGNMQEKKDIRQEKLSDIKDIREGAKGEITDLRSQIPMVKREIKEGSSTEMFRKMKDQKMQIVNKMKKDAFQVRKDALVKQLNIALENLTNIAARIAERITKAENSGRNMTDAKASLAIANDKLVKAKVAITALASFTPTTGTTTGTTTAEVDVQKPRQIGDAAIKAVKDALDALKKVVQDIAHNMGLGEKKTGSSTPPVTGTTTDTTTTTTDTDTSSTTSTTTNQ